MKLRGCFALALLLAACDKPAEVTVEESRELTMIDENPKLNATSDDRFQPPGSGPFIAGAVPPTWLVQPPSAFRLLSYRFGTGGEVAVGISAGDVLSNVNRWLGQFGQPALDQAGIDALEKGEVTGATGVWVEASGEYLPGMGQPPRSGQALYGIVAEEGGRIITVKMTGPADEVAAQKEALKAFTATLRKRGE